jgi:hypothetical protein
MMANREIVSIELQQTTNETSDGKNSDGNFDLSEGESSNTESSEDSDDKSDEESNNDVATCQGSWIDEESSDDGSEDWESGSLRRAFTRGSTRFLMQSALTMDQLWGPFLLTPSLDGSFEDFDLSEPDSEFELE